MEFAAPPAAAPNLALAVRPFCERAWVHNPATETRSRNQQDEIVSRKSLPALLEPNLQSLPTVQPVFAQRPNAQTVLARLFSIACRQPSVE